MTPTKEDVLNIVMVYTCVEEVTQAPSRDLVAQAMGAALTMGDPGTLFVTAAVAAGYFARLLAKESGETVHDFLTRILRDVHGAETANLFIETMASIKEHQAEPSNITDITNHQPKGTQQP